MRKSRMDGPIFVFGLIAAAALVVSAPATFNLVALYHSDGTVFGIAATVALLVILELGAVAAKLATLWVREGRGWLDAFVFGALSVNTLSNWLHGAALAGERGLAWPAAWLGSLVYAAFLPALLFLMLHLICARVAALSGRAVSAEEEVAMALRPVAHAVEVARQASAALAVIAPPPALPAPQASYPRVAGERSEPVLVPQSACPQCGQGASRMQLVAAPQHKGWRCSCGYKVPMVAMSQQDGL